MSYECHGAGSRRSSGWRCVGTDIGDRFHPHGQRHLEAEIADMQKDIERQKEKAVAAAERLERTKKCLALLTN